MTQDFFMRVITGNGMLIVDYDPEQNSKVWSAHRKLPMSAHKIIVRIPKIKAMFMVHKGFMPQGQIFNQGYYQEVLEWLQKSVLRVLPNIIGCCITTTHPVTLHCLCACFWRERTLHWSSNHLINHIPHTVHFLLTDLKNHPRDHHFDTTDIKKAVTNQLNRLTDEP